MPYYHLLSDNNELLWCKGAIKGVRLLGACNRALEEIREMIQRLEPPAKTGQHDGDRKSAEFQGV